MENFIGKYISLNCKDGLGVFQGQIIRVDRNSITLDKAFHDGRPHLIQPVTIQSKHIKALELLNVPAATNTANSAANHQVKVERPVPLRADVGPTPRKQEILTTAVTPCLRKPDKVTRPNNESRKIEGVVDSRCSPRRLDLAALRRDRRLRPGHRDEEAFGSPVDHTLFADFDFEKNLALFDKKAVYDEINASKPDLVRHSEKKNGNYRCTENVLEVESIRLQQIRVPEPDRMEYVTDAGLIVPSVTSTLRVKIGSMAEDAGLTFLRQADLLARGAVEIALHLLGGAHRLNPHNVHQCPSVAVLCGGQRAGIQAAACARQLASHGVRTTLYVTEAPGSSDISTELSLARISGCRLTANPDELSSLAVDLIIMGLFNPGKICRGPPSAATKWAQNHRAPIIALDPPPLGTAGLTAKCCVVPILPLSHDSSNGRIYLANIGIPRGVFTRAGIDYSPPFGPKFVIPLYPNDG